MCNRDARVASCWIGDPKSGYWMHQQSGVALGEGLQHLFELKDIDAVGAQVAAAYSSFADPYPTAARACTGRALGKVWRSSRTSTLPYCFQKPPLL